jgi:hypothetical protein
MDEERSPLIDIVGDESEVPRVEVSAMNSSSEDSSGGGSSDDVKAKVEDIVVMDPRESMRSYDFGLSTVTVGRIQRLELLGHFTEGAACEPGEETILKSADDEAIVFEEFFTEGLRMPPHPALTDILINYQV